MPSPTRFAAAALVALVLASPPLRAQEARSAPQVNKLTIHNGDARSVFYTVKGGSVRLRARYRLLQYAENEVALVDQLQRLKMDYVANERLLEAMRGQSGGGLDIGGMGRESSIKQTLADTLAQEATPEAAVQLLDMLEHAETEVEAELQKLPPEQRDRLLDQLDGVERAPARAAGAPANAPAAAGGAPARAAAPAGGAAVNAPAPQPPAGPVVLGPMAGNPFLALANGPAPAPAPAAAVATALLACLVAVFLRASPTL